MIAKKISLFAAVFLFMLPAIALTFNPEAQAADVLKNVCSRKPNAAVCKDKGNPNRTNTQNNPIFGPNGIITVVVNIISALVGMAAVIMVILAGFKFITSGSNPQEVGAAREMIIYAVVGLIVVATAQVLVRFVLVRLI